MKELARHTSFGERLSLLILLSTEEVRTKSTGSPSQNAKTAIYMCLDPKRPRWARRGRGKGLEKTIFYDFI